MTQTLTPADADGIEVNPSRVNHDVVAKASALVPLIREHADQSSLTVVWFQRSWPRWRHRDCSSC
jgi:hypothetical protein